MAITQRSKSIRKFWKKHVDKWREEGGSRQKYSNENKLNAKSFAYWCRRLGFRTGLRKSGREQSPPASRKSLPVTFVPLPISPVHARTVEKISVLIKDRFKVVVSENFSPGLLSEVVTTLEKIP